MAVAEGEGSGERSRTAARSSRWLMNPKRVSLLRLIGACLIFRFTGLLMCPTKARREISDPNLINDVVPFRTRSGYTSVSFAGLRVLVHASDAATLLYTLLPALFTLF